MPCYNWYGIDCKPGSATPYPGSNRSQPAAERLILEWRIKRLVSIVKQLSPLPDTHGAAACHERSLSQAHGMSKGLPDDFGMPALLLSNYNTSCTCCWIVCKYTRSS
jgi:hypothetical protein